MGIKTGKKKKIILLLLLIIPVSIYCLARVIPGQKITCLFKKKIVAKVIDGDTVILSNDDHIRLIGVDTPELNSASKPVRYFAEEAREFTKNMVEGKGVRLKYGPQKKEKHGRIFAYVYLSDGRLLNAEIIKQGYGYVFLGSPFKYQEKFKEYQNLAQKGKRGFWGQKDGLTIAWRDAHNYYGKYVTVKGTVVDTVNSGKACFLNFHPEGKKDFRAVIFSSDFHRFPDSPENYFNNKQVKIFGLVREYKGMPEIILRDSWQIKVIPEGLKILSGKIKTTGKIIRGTVSSEFSIKIPSDKVIKK
ncbi:MAG: thermonuclease family protein [Candidatus Ratteibacteria bacterium]|nr:thermonuclease family protein [Candidatus Ratteibacteria bacterium]